MVNAMTSDPDGIGYAGLLYHNPNVRPVAIAAAGRGPYVLPTRDSVMNHTYPLTRLITMYLNREPASPSSRNWRNSSATC